jgi:hypothetical protein
MTEGWQPTDDPEAPAPDPEKLVTAPSGPTVKRSTRRPGQSTRSRAKAPRSRSKASPAAPPTPSTQEALQGLLQLPAGGLIIAGKRANSIPLIADGATILVHGPALAAAIAEIAENDPRVMALLEKVITFGPYGGLATAMILMAGQFARNHGAPEELTTMTGAVTPEQIISAGGIDLTVIETPPPSDNGQRKDDDSPNI